MRVVVGAVVLIAVAVASDARAGDSPRAIAAIENDLVADDPAVRAKAAAELTDRFPDGAVAVPMLVDLLDDESPEVAAAAAKAIDAMAVAATVPLVDYFADDSHLGPKTAIGSSLPITLDLGGGSAQAAIDRDKVVAGTAKVDEVALAALFGATDELAGDEQSAMPLLLAVVRKGTPDARSLASAAISMMGADFVQKSGVATPPLDGRTKAAAYAARLVRQELDVQAWIGTRLITRVRGGDAATVKILTEALTADKTSTKTTLGSASTYTRGGACDALAAIGPAAAAAAPTLLDGIADPQEKRLTDLLSCVYALVKIGREEDVVQRMTVGGDDAVLLAVGLSVDARRPDLVVPLLVERMNESKKPLPFAVSAMSRYGAAAEKSLVAIRRAAQSGPEINLRLLCADAILAIAPTDGGALLMLYDMLKDPESADAARGGPGRPIAIIAKRAAPSTPVAAKLVAAVKKAASGDEYASCDFNVLVGIARMGPLAKAAVPDLVKLLANADHLCADVTRAPRYSLRRRRIVVALGHIGPDAGAVIPTLTALRDKGDETIRVPAAQALRRMKAKK